MTERGEPVEELARLPEVAGRETLLEGFVGGLEGAQSLISAALPGEQLVLDSGDPLFRARFRAGVDERDAALAAGMRRAGVPLHVVPTDRDLVQSLVEVVSSTRWRRA